LKRLLNLEKRKCTASDERASRLLDEISAKSQQKEKLKEEQLK
jgi:hypothetical protein